MKDDDLMDLCTISADDFAYASPALVSDGDGDDDFVMIE